MALRIIHPIANGTYITQYFGLTEFAKNGYYGHDPITGKVRGHNGLDFRARTPLPVYAPFSGTVTKAVTSDSGYGYHVKIRNKEYGVECVLAHLSKVEVREGLNIDAGDRIGFTGNTGYSTAPHLHFGIRFLHNLSPLPIKNWTVKGYDLNMYGYVDPLPYIQRAEKVNNKSIFYLSNLKAAARRLFKTGNMKSFSKLTKVISKRSKKV